MNIQNTRDLGSDGIKVVVAGEAGNGKTTLARTLVEGLKDEKVFIISAEAGLLSLRGTDIDTCDLRFADDGSFISKENRIARLGQVHSWLMEPEQVKKYRWVFVDSLTEINQNMLEKLEADPDFQGPKNTIKKFGELSTRMRGLAKTFRDLPGYNVVFTALVKSNTDSDQKTTMGIDMVGAFSEKLPALFDEIFYLGVLAEIDEKTGRNKRTLLTQKTDKVTFPKDRSGALDRLEPADLSLIAKKIREKAKQPMAIPAAVAPAESPSVPAPAAAPLVADISAKAKEAAALVASVPRK